MTASSNIQNPAKLEQLQAITREYAKFSRSATGLGGVIGGMIGLAIFLIGAFSNPPLWARALMVLALPIWFVLKAWLRNHYYQRHGTALETLDKLSTNVERFVQGGIGGIAAVMLIICAFLVITNPEKVASLPILNKIALLAAPLAGLLLWRQINTVLEFLVVMNLMVQTVMLASGSNWTWGNQITMLFYSGLLIVIGLVEHFRFRKLETQLQNLRGQP
jgi:hypothetical protein